MTTCITVDIITFPGVVVKVMTIVCDDNTTSPLLQVVAPLMGWVRNYHGYQFFDRRDGAAWGPEDSSAIDMMHMAMNGFDYLDDRKTRLAEILQVTLLLPLLLPIFLPWSKWSLWD